MKIGVCFKVVPDYEGFVAEEWADVDNLDFTYAKKIFHGKQSKIEHDGTSIFTGINSPIKVARYHSLAVQQESLPECLKIMAQTEDGEIMAIRHKEYPVIGLQFHPESIYTEHGKRLIENFVNDVI